MKTVNLAQGGDKNMSGQNCLNFTQHATDCYFCWETYRFSWKCIQLFNYLQMIIKVGERIIQSFICTSHHLNHVIISFHISEIDMTNLAETLTSCKSTPLCISKHELILICCKVFFRQQQPWISQILIARF